MKIIKIVNEKYLQNNYLVIDNESAVLIDASAEISQVEENLNIYKPKATIGAIFLTHCHFDHIGELDNLCEKYNCPVYIHKLGKPSLYKPTENMSTLDTPIKIKQRKMIKTFVDGEEISVGSIKVQCYLTAGHSHDSSCFRINDNLFTGDTVFKVDIGRSDLFGGDQKVQKISLERIKNDLAKDINVCYAGHGANFDYDDLIFNINHFLGE